MVESKLGISTDSQKWSKSLREALPACYAHIVISPLARSAPIPIHLLNADPNRQTDALIHTHLSFVVIRGKRKVLQDVSIKWQWRI